MVFAKSGSPGMPAGKTRYRQAGSGLWLDDFGPTMNRMTSQIVPHLTTALHGPLPMAEEHLQERPYCADRLGLEDFSAA